MLQIKFLKPFVFGISTLFIFLFLGKLNLVYADARSESLSAELDEMSAAGVDGFLYWQYSGDVGQEPGFGSDIYSFFKGDPICGVLQANASKFGFIGVNVANLVNSGYADDALTYLASCGVNLVRIFGSPDRNGLGARSILDLAASKGIRVIVAICDFPNTCSDLGITNDVVANPISWYQSGYTEPAGGANYSGSYLAYAQDLASALKDSPGLYGYELLNEPHCGGNSACVSVYAQWANNVAAAIRAVDSVHPVGIGQMAGQPGTRGDSAGAGNPPDFTVSNSSGSIGMASGHYYTDSEKEQMFLAVSQAHSLGKTFYIGELGLDCADDPDCLAAGGSGNDLVPVKIKGHVYSRDPELISGFTNKTSNLPANGVVVRAYSGWWGDGTVTDGIGGKANGMITDRAENVPSRCATTGRKTTHTSAKLDCEEELAVQCDPDNPPPEGCAGYYEFTTYITSGNFNSGNYILFFCGSEDKPSEVYWVSLPPGNTTEITLDVTVACPSSNTPMEPDDEIAFVSETTAACDAGDPQVSRFIENRDFYSKEMLIDRQVDGSFVGVNPNTDFEDLPPTTVLEVGKDLEARASQVASFDLRNIRGGLFQLCGSPYTYLEPALEDEASQYAKCEDLKASNDTLSQEGKENYNSYLRYNAGLKLLSAYDQEAIFNASLKDPNTGEMKEEYKNLTICTDNAGNEVKLSQIQSPFEEFDASKHTYGDLYFPYCMIFGGDLDDAQGQYWTWPENDSYWSPNGEWRGDEEIDFETGTIGDLSGAGKEAVYSILPSGSSKTGSGETSLKKLEKMLYEHKLANVLATPYIDYTNEASANSEIAAAFDQSRIIRRIGVPTDLCTYGIEDKDRILSNDFKRLPNQEDKRAPIGKWASEKSLATGGSATSVLGIPVTGLDAFLSGFLDLVKAIFGINQQNLDPDYPASDCTLPEWTSLGAGSCDLDEDTCRVDECIITNSAVCDVNYDPEIGGCECDAIGYDPNTVCSGASGLSPSDYTCSYEGKIPSDYDCRGDEKVIAQINTFSPVHPKVENFAMVPYLQVWGQPYVREFIGGCMVENTHAITKTELPKPAYYMDNPAGDCYLYNMYASNRAVGDVNISPADYEIAEPGQSFGSGNTCNEFNCGGDTNNNFEASLDCAANTVDNDIDMRLAQMVEKYGPWCDNEAYNNSLGEGDPHPFGYNLMTVYDSIAGQLGQRSCSEQPPSYNEILAEHESNPEIADDWLVICPALGDPIRSPGNPSYDFYRGALENCGLTESQRTWSGSTGGASVDQIYSDICSGDAIYYLGVWLNSDYNCDGEGGNRLYPVLSAAQSRDINPYYLLSLWATESAWGQSNPSCMTP